MLADKVVNPVEYTQAASMNRNHQPSQSFQDVLKRTLKGRSKVRSPKIELTGVLIPCHQVCGGETIRFKLGTQSSEYLLSLRQSLFELAKKASWDEVTIKGVLAEDSNLIEVEKIILKSSEEDEVVNAGFREHFLGERRISAFPTRLISRFLR